MKVSRRKAIPGWHWLNKDGTLAHINPPVKVKAGRIYKMKGRVNLCKRGFHSSQNLRDTLQYAPGPVLEKVISWGHVLEASDKLVASHRKCLAVLDAEKVISESGIRVLRERYKNKRVPQKVELAIKAKRSYLRGDLSYSEFYWRMEKVNYDTRVLLGDYKNILEYIEYNKKEWDRMERILVNALNREEQRLKRTRP